MPCGNLGTSELLIICVLILLLFGAKRLPALARSIGSGINEFKKGLNTPFSDIEDPEDTDEKVKKKKTKSNKTKPKNRT